MRDYFLLICIFFFIAVWKGWQPGQWLLDHSTTAVCRVLIKGGRLDNPCIADGHPRRQVILTTRFFIAEKPRERRIVPVGVTPLPLEKKVTPLSADLGDTELEKLQKKAQEEESANEIESTRNKSGVEFGGFQL